MERGKRLPTVGVGAGYLYYNVTDKDVDDGLVFAQVSVPISDWWGGAHALKKARIRERQAENDRQQAREMLAVEIERTWSEVVEAYAQIEEKYESRGREAIGHIERFAFYEEAKKAYAIIATGETALYANVMLQKGVVTD